MKTFARFLVCVCCFAPMGCTLVNVPIYATLEATETFQPKLKVEGAECSRIYMADAGGVSVLDPSTGKIQKLAVFPGMDHIWISPNAERVVLEERFKRRSEERIIWRERLWVADLPDGEPQLIAETEGKGWLAVRGWLSGGTSVVYQLRSAASDTYFVYDTETGQRREVSEPPFDRPRVRCARSQSDEECGWRILLQTPDGEERLIGCGYDAQLSQSGQIAFISGERSITISDLDGNVLRELPRQGAFRIAAFSPCGRYLLLENLVEPGILYVTSKLSIVDVETERRVTHMFPYWLPNEFVWVATCEPGGSDERIHDPDP